MSATSDLTLRAVDVHRTFRTGEADLHVLKGVTLEVSPGERVFLIGPSGAGKTTLLYVLGGLEAPDRGEILLGGKSLYAASSGEQASMRNTMIGYVFQNYLLLPELTALENVCLPAMIGGKRSKQRAEELLKSVGLGARINHLPSELSGGEQQRVAIARALINDPQFIFADEPTGNLDSRTGGDIMRLLLDLAKEKGKTLVVVTHDSRLSALGDRTLSMQDGLIAA